MVLSTSNEFDKTIFCLLNRKGPWLQRQFLIQNTIGIVILKGQRVVIICKVIQALVIEQLGASSLTSWRISGGKQNQDWKSKNTIFVLIYAQSLKPPTHMSHVHCILNWFQLDFYHLQPRVQKSKLSLTTLLISSCLITYILEYLKMQSK